MAGKNPDIYVKKSIVDTKADYNTQFDVPKLLKMDSAELEKLNKLFPIYQRRYFPRFTEDTWQECMMKFFEKAHTFDMEKSKGKFLGWFSILVFHEFVAQENRSGYKKHKSNVEYLDEQDTKEILFDEDTIEFLYEKENMIERMKSLLTKEEFLIVELYIGNAELTREERFKLRKIKTKLLRSIYTTEQLKRFREKKSGRYKNKRSIQRAIVNENYKNEGRRNMSKEERRELAIKKRDMRRKEKLARLKETDPELYKETLRRMEIYDFNAKNKNNASKKWQQKAYEEKQAEKIKMREKILNEKKDGQK